jgi:hypothetical protein
MDILAANALALALSPVYSPGVNLVRATFLDPEVRRLVGDWEAVARTAVARLRALAGPDVEDPRLVALVDELSVRSDRFRRLWARHDIEPVAIPTRAFNHALVGLIELRADQLAIAGTERQLLIVYHAKAGSPSERALCRRRQPSLAPFELRCIVRLGAGRSRCEGCRIELSARVLASFCRETAGNDFGEAAFSGRLALLFHLYV